MSFLRGFLQAPVVRTLFQQSPFAAPVRGFHSLLSSTLNRTGLSSSIVAGDFNLIATREMNRNARRPKKANHGKRPVCNARRRAKRDIIKSRAYREKIFGFW